MTMKTRFRMNIMDIKAVYATIGGFAFSAFLMFVPLILSASFAKLAIGTAIVIILLTVLWFGFTRGSYTTVDENNNLYGTVFFIRCRMTPLSDVISLGTRGTFMGAMTTINFTFRNKKGVLETRSVATKEVLEKKDLQKLIEAIHSANPNINIPKELIEG